MVFFQADLVFIFVLSYGVEVLDLNLKVLNESVDMSE